LAVGATTPPHVERAVVVDGPLGAPREFFAYAGVKGGHEVQK
jgi:hypothetical protein